MKEYYYQKLIETVLYVLYKTGGLDMYHLFKILYFADRDFISETGLRIVDDRFAALPYGPVPASLYDAIKGSTYADLELTDLFNKAVENAGNEAPGILMARREPDMDFLAQAAIPYLDKSIDENKNLTFQELLAKSHDNAWKKASERPGKTIAPTDMAEAAGCNPDFLEYINEMQELEDILQR